MKKNTKYGLLSVILLLFYLQANAQNVGVNPNNIQFGNDFQLFKYNDKVGGVTLRSLNNTYPPSIYFETGNGSNFGYFGGGLSNFEIGSFDSFRILTYTNVWGPRFTVVNNGNIGIGTTSPSTKLEVNGFTKLGTDAPAIKIKKLISGCTTSANSGFPSGEISLTHGITPSKILKVEALVEYATNFWVKDGNDLFGYEFDIYVTNTTISLRNLSGSASSEIRSKPCKILITYEE